MAAYYNEFDPGAAAWLRELIKQGLIADGEIDERSILEVRPVDLIGFTQCHFFAGIGGWSLALRLAGWPDSRPVWTGSPPCQPFSAAGRQLGKDDERHLAPHFASLVAAGRPDTLFGEQVASAAVFGKATGRSRKSVEGQAPFEWAWLDDLFERLEAAHYACGASDIPAAGVGAAHIRQRTFFGAQRLADTNCNGCDKVSLDRVHDAEHNAEPCCGLRRLADADDERSQGRPGMSERAGERLVGAGGVGGGLAGALHAGRPEWRSCAGSGSAAGGGGGIGGVYDASSAGRQVTGRYAIALGERQADDTPRRGEAGKRGVGSSATPAPDIGWPSADWLYCRDGKLRPVEPGTFPLAHGVSARVGRLRGYGNAIVPQAAAVFIEAFSEVIGANRG